MTTTLKLQQGVQPTRWKWIDVVLANHASAVNLPVINLPAGAIVTGGFVIVTQVFNSTSSDVLDIGDQTTENRYKNDINLQALGYTAIVPTGFVVPIGGTQIIAQWTSGGGTPTTGTYTLAIAYIVRGVSDLGPQS